MDLNRLYLNNCFLCASDGSILCPKCFDSYIRRGIQRKCHVCGNPVYSGLMHKECRDYSYLDGVIYLSDYSELVRELIFLGKYSGSYSIFKEFGKYLYQFSKDELVGGKGLITSVPLHKSRFLERGFNQAEIFGREFSLNSQIPYFDLLQRVKKSTKQSSLDKEHRMSNIANLFKIKGVGAYLNRFDTIYICDDIYTTGRTLSECAKAIKEVFSGKIVGVVVAKV